MPKSTQHGVPQRSEIDLQAAWGQLGPLGANLGPTWANLGPTWANLGPTWANLGPTWAQLGANLGPTWAILGPLGPSWANLGPTGANLGPTWGQLGPPRAPKRTPKPMKNTKNTKNASFFKTQAIHRTAASTRKSYSKILVKRSFETALRKIHETPKAQWPVLGAQPHWRSGH